MTTMTLPCPLCGQDVAVTLQFTASPVSPDPSTICCKIEAGKIDHICPPGPGRGIRGIGCRMITDQPWLPPGARIDTSTHVARACRSCGGTRTTVDASGVTDCSACRGTGTDPASLPDGAVVYRLTRNDEETA